MKITHFAFVTRSFSVLSLVHVYCLYVVWHLLVGAWHRHHWRNTEPIVCQSSDANCKWKADCHNVENCFLPCEKLKRTKNNTKINIEIHQNESSKTRTRNSQNELAIFICCVRAIKHRKRRAQKADERENIWKHGNEKQTIAHQLKKTDGVDTIWFRTSHFTFVACISYHWIRRCLPNPN